MATLLLALDTWDLVLDAKNNIAVATEPYSLAQDASSAIRTFEGECIWDTEIGMPYLSQILGHRPPPALLKQLMSDEALAATTPQVVSAQVFFNAIQDRILTGQVQVITENGDVSAAPIQYVTTNPQGA